MSGNENGLINLKDPQTLKDWSLILLISAVALTFIVFAIGMAVAISTGQAVISFTGEIDLGQFTAIIVGIAVTATVLIAQQLTQKNTVAAIRANDETWLASEKE